MSEWKECKLSEVLHLMGGGTPKTSIPEYWNGNIPWLSVTDFNNGRKYCYSTEKSITENGLKESSTKILKKGQVIISARGTVGVVSMLGEDMAFNQSNYGIDANPEYTCNDYLYYWLKNALPVFLTNSYGAVFDTITKSTFENLSILLPPLPEQRAIASILSSFDDKIDLLHKENKTLEAIAEILFKEMFVQPSPNLSQGERGEGAKEDWDICTLNDLCTQIASGGTPSTKIESYYNGDINWYSTKELKDNFLYESENKITKEGLDNSSAKLFPPGTVVIAIYAAPTVGRLGILANEASFNQAACGLIANEEFCCSEFIYLYLKNQRDELNLMASGSAQQNLNVGKIKSYPAFKVPKDLMNKFKDAIQPNFKKIKSNTLQIRTLEKLRDTLLPKLMSGKVRVVVEETGEEEGAVDFISPHIDEGITSWPVNNKFREAVLFSGIVAEMGDERFNPDRVRVTKAGYLAKRYMGMEVLGEYAKMEAGPYDSAIRYKGPEKIAIKNNYVEAVESTHFKRGEKFEDVEKYLERYGYKPALEWLAQFRFTKNKELELLATVDYAALDLMRLEKDVTVEGIMAYLEKDKKWGKKLEKKADVFNEEGVRRALKELSMLFTKTYNRVPK